MSRKKPGRSQFSGRLRVVLSLCSLSKFSLNVGSKDVRFGESTLNLDLDAESKPDIVADARLLPFKDDLFEQIFLADVIEHLPDKHEWLALQEAYRVLKDGGVAILSTPHNHAFYALIDPAKYVMTHRHYRKGEVIQLLKSSKFRVLEVLVAGDVWASINNLWYSFVTYPLKRILAVSLPYAPRFMRGLENKGYDRLKDNGYTIFAKSLKDASIAE